MNDLKRAKREAHYRRRLIASKKRKRAVQQLRCFWTWPFGHPWENYPGDYVRPAGAIKDVRLGPLKVCPFCPAEDWGSGEQSIGG